FEMEEAGLVISDQEIILAITLGLLPSYTTVILSFNIVAADALTLDYVMNHLLNNEVAQLTGGTQKSTVAATNAKHDAKESALTASNMKSPAGKGICFFCNQCGHHKEECPE
ncbi:hypothetical protein BDP27DRAFT_1230622, partial [Rhodocollybia butyracea]